ncbi:MAG: patatin-like phospholipase family protein [Colwellia sp.]
MLEIYAGDTALKTIKEQGFSPRLFNTFLGASGGPKWFTLYGLDKYIFGEFFQGREQPLNLIGSSVGAFRTACFAQKDPISALNRFVKEYCGTVYSERVTPAEVTQKARILLGVLFGDNGIDEIINNPVYKAHFIVTKNHGFVGSENRLIQGIGLLKSMLLNSIDRSLLKHQYQRYIFQTQDSQLTLRDPANIPTKTITLSTANIKEALLASGAIPLVMQGIKDIAGCPKGMYRDGGLIDYHFDIDINNKGLVLYPHFNAILKAGWFDKKLTRKVRAQHYDNTVLLCPSQRFIEALPYGKIPDRSDFSALEPEKRAQYWQRVCHESEKLAQEFSAFYQQQDIGRIKNINQLLDPY